MSNIPRKMTGADIDRAGGALLSDIGAVPRAIGDGMADDSQAFADVFDAAPDGARITLRPGSYRLANLAIADKRLTLDLTSGAALVQATNAPVLSWSGAWTTFSVSALATVKYTPPGQVEGVGSTWVTVLTVAAGHSLAKGDLVRVISDDVYPWSETFTLGGVANGKYRRGEDSAVIGVVGNTVYLAGLLREAASMVTNVRVARRSQKGLTLIRPRIVAPSGQNWTSDSVVINGGMGHLIDGLTADVGYRKILVMRGTLLSRVQNPIGRDLADKPNLGQYGYLVSDTASTGLVTDGVSGTFARHAFTTNGTATLPGDPDPSKYGLARGGIVRAGVGFACTHEPFDFHHETDGYTVEGGQAIQTWYGSTADGGEAGLKLRGRGVKVKGLTIRGGGGIDVIAPDGVLDLDHTIDGCDIEASGMAALKSQKATAGGERVKFGRVINSRLKAQKNTGDVGCLHLLDVEIRFRGCEIASSTDENSAALVTHANARIIMDGVEYDQSAATGSQQRTFRDLNTYASGDIDRTTSFITHRGSGFGKVADLQVCVFDAANQYGVYLFQGRLDFDRRPPSAQGNAVGSFIANSNVRGVRGGFTLGGRISNFNFRDTQNTTIPVRETLTQISASAGATVMNVDHTDSSGLPLEIGYEKEIWRTNSGVNDDTPITLNFTRAFFDPAGVQRTSMTILGQNARVRLRWVGMGDGTGGSTDRYQVVSAVGTINYA